MEHYSSEDLHGDDSYHYYYYDDEQSCDILRNLTIEMNANSSSRNISLNGSLIDQMSLENCSDYLDHWYGESWEYEVHNTIHHFDSPTYLRFYLLAIIIPIGLLFNLLSCAVFVQSHMQKSATVFYFFALACADNIVLLGELLDWLNTHTSKGYITGLQFIHVVDGACKFVYFLRYFGRFLSSWLVVTICIERFITVAYPFKSTWSSTPKRAMMVITGVTAVCMILSCPPFFMLGTTMNNHTQHLECNTLAPYKPSYDKWIWCIIIAGELIIPSIIVIIFTTLIIVKLKKARLRRMLSKEGQGKDRNNRKDNQPTIALLAVSIAFATLRAPYVFMYPLHLKQNVLFPFSQMGRFVTAFQITYVLAVTNYAVNFLLYIVTGRKFRNEFVKFLLCKARRDSTWSRSSRSHSVSSQYTSIRRASNGEALQSRIYHPVQKERNGSSSCQDAQL